VGSNPIVSTGVVVATTFNLVMTHVSCPIGSPVALARDRPTPTSAAAAVVSQRSATQARNSSEGVAHASISPNAEAGAPSVEFKRLGNRAVGTSWPTSARKLAAPMPLTPGVSHSADSTSDV
jgi:hypothetical protein